MSVYPQFTQVVDVSSQGCFTYLNEDGVECQSDSFLISREETIGHDSFANTFENNPLTKLAFSYIKYLIAGKFDYFAYPKFLSEITPSPNPMNTLKVTFYKNKKDKMNMKVDLMCYDLSYISTHKSKPFNLYLAKKHEHILTYHNDALYLSADIIRIQHEVTEAKGDRMKYDMILDRRVNLGWDDNYTRSVIGVVRFINGSYINYKALGSESYAWKDEELQIVGFNCTSL